MDLIYSHLDPQTDGPHLPACLGWSLVPHSHIQDSFCLWLLCRNSKFLRIFSFTNWELSWVGVGRLALRPLLPLLYLLSSMSSSLSPQALAPTFNLLVPRFSSNCTLCCGCCVFVCLFLGFFCHVCPFSLQTCLRMIRITAQHSQY